MNVPRGLKEIIATYGQPGTNIVRTALPWPFRLAWDTAITVNSISVHRLVVHDLLSILHALWNHERLAVKQEVGFDTYSTVEYDTLTLKRIQADGLDLFGGAFNYRVKVGSSKKLSTHSWGIAIDLDPVHNPYGKKGTMPDWVIEIFLERGFTWGGKWRTPDPMHFARCSGY